MRKLYLTAGVALLGMFSVGCAHTPYQPGLLYADDARPYHATTNEVGSLTGSSSQTNILGLFSTGDAGISSAASDGGIETISTIDTEYMNILGVFGVTTTRVTGE